MFAAIAFAAACKFNSQQSQTLSATTSSALTLQEACATYQKNIAKSCTMDAAIESATAAVSASALPELTKDLALDSASIRLAVSGGNSPPSPSTSPMYPHLVALFSAAAHWEGPQKKLAESNSLDVSQVQSQICQTAKDNLLVAVQKISLP